VLDRVRVLGLGLELRFKVYRVRVSGNTFKWFSVRHPFGQVY